MTNGSTPRPDGLLLYEAHRKAVTYRLAMVDALRALDPRGCRCCRLAVDILESVDRVPVTSFDVALAFGVYVETVYTWARDGKIPSWVDDNGRRRFDTATIDALLH